MRLDTFLNNYLSGAAEYANAWNVMKTLMIFSHGQATVERGFSVNKCIEIENLKEITYVSKRLVYDYVNSFNNIHEIPITDDIRKAASASRMKYEQYLEEQKKQKQSSSSENKRKILREEMDFVKRKKMCIEKEISELQKSADELAEKAELSKDISLFIQSNKLRKIAREKNDELKQIEEKKQQIVEV